MINWQKVCWDIRKHYGSLSMVAGQIGCTPSALQKLARGETEQPYYGTGSELLKIHSKINDVG